MWDTNLYAYVENNPVNWVDPWGLQSIVIPVMGPPVVFPGGHIPGFDGVPGMGTGNAGEGRNSGNSCTKGDAGETDWGTSKKGKGGKGNPDKGKGDQEETSGTNPGNPGNFENDSEEIRWRKNPGYDGSRSRIRKIKDFLGKTKEVWHEVFDKDGSVIHRD